MPKSEEKELFDQAVSKKIKKNKPSKLIIFVLIITLFLSIINFIYNLYLDKSLYYIINSLLLLIFNILFIMVIYKSLIKQKTLVILGSLFLIIIYLFNIYVNYSNLFSTSNLINKDIISVLDYSKINNLKLDYDYEYSDLIKENHLITYKENNNKMKLSISLGPNPEKDIYLPNMVSWQSEDVIDYLEDNKINNVNIEFVSSDKLENTLIEQSKKNHMKRDDELKLKFSYGNELGFDNCEIRSLIGMDLLHVVMYLEKNKLKYEIIYDYSNKFKKDIIYKQSIEPGDKVKVNDKTIKIYVSKGKKIKMIDLTNKDIYEASKWLIDNKLIVKNEYRYDSKIKKDHIIKSDKDKDDIVSSGDIITIYLSKGPIKIKKYKTIDEFEKWAIKNEIDYYVEYEFSDKYKTGEIISSKVDEYNKVNLVVSEGIRNKMIDVTGLSEKEAKNKLDKKNIKYNITYEKGDKGKVLRQSISEGANISKDTTVSLIVGK